MTTAEYLERLRLIREQKRREYARERYARVEATDPRCTAVRNQLRADIRAWKKQQQKGQTNGKAE